MDLKKENGKYIFDCFPKYHSDFPLPKNEYLEVPLTKCSSEIIDKMTIYPYEDNNDIKKTKINLFYYDVPTDEKYRVELEYYIEYKGWFKKIETKKYWKIEVLRITSFYDRGMLTDRQGLGNSLPYEIEKIFSNGKIDKKNIIEFLLKFNYTRYIKNRNLKIGGV